MASGEVASGEVASCSQGAMLGSCVRSPAAYFMRAFFFARIFCRLASAFSAAVWTAADDILDGLVQEVEWTLRWLFDIGLTGKVAGRN